MIDESIEAGHTVAAGIAGIVARVAGTAGVVVGSPARRRTPPGDGDDGGGTWPLVELRCTVRFCGQSIICICGVQGQLGLWRFVFSWWVRIDFVQRQ